MPDLSTTQWLLLAAVGSFEIALLLTAYVILFRTPANRLTLPRVAWALLCLIQFIGPIAFLMAGRKPAELELRSRPGDPGGTVETTIDILYGAPR